MKTSLRVSMFAVLVGLFLVTSASVAWYTYYSSRRVVLELSETIIGQVTDDVIERTNNYLAPLQNSSKLTASLTTEHAFTTQRESLARYMIDTIYTYPQLCSVYVGFEDGSMLQVVHLREGKVQYGKRPNPPGAHYLVRVLDLTGESPSETRVFYNGAHEVLGTHEGVEDAAYDPRKRPWYTGPAASGEIFWSDLYMYFTLQTPGITASVPVFGPDGHLRAVVAADVELDELTAFLQRLEVGRTGSAFIMNDREEIVAFPADIPIAVGPDGEARLLRMTDVETSWVREAVTRYAAQGQAKFQFQAGDGTDYLASFTPLPLASNKSWVVGVVVPTNDYIGSLKGTNRNILIFSVLFSLLLALGVGAALNRLIRARVESAIAATRVGEYTLEAKIGAGGMGEVYRARHSMLRRPTAVKLLRPELSTELDIQRFEREVQLTCRLTHPNTITIFDYGRTVDGRFYYAMEFLDGATLHDLTDYAGAIPAGRAIFLVEQLCAALVEAHAIGLIHRDIKTANVLVAELGGRGDFVKVVDFGLVKDIEVSKDMDLTQDGAISGTPGFLAPEVVSRANDAGPLSDIYAVGAVLYVLLTGQMPFAGDTPMAVLVAQQLDDPQRPSEALGATIAADLEALVMRCLDRDPSVRPQTTSKLLDQLMACVDYGSWTAADATRWWRQWGDELRAGELAEEMLSVRTTFIVETREL